MKKLLHEYPGEPIKIILDNAKYQHCKVIKMFALLHGIELIFLPTYSPNFNRIERLWKLVKSEVLNAAYFGCFTAAGSLDLFKSTIDSCASKINTKHLSLINSLISENVQNFCDIRVLATS